MDYLNYICEVAQDFYDDLYFKYIDYKYDFKYDNKETYRSNSISEDEINKLIEETKKEIQVDKEIKHLEKRYQILCDDYNKYIENNENDENNNTNNNTNNNDGAIMIKNKKIGTLV